MLFGAPLGGPPGKALVGLMSQGAKVIIPCGLEKLGPGQVSDAIRACGRGKVDKPMGMAVGLVPIVGEVVTEVEACRIISGVKAVVISRGGICGAEGATTLVADGAPDEIARLIETVRSVKGTALSGIEATLEECQEGSENCTRHRQCDAFFRS